MRRTIASIDFGSDSIKIVVAEIYKNRTHVLAATSVPSEGIKKGLIVNPAEAITSLKNGLKKIEDLLGIPLKKAIVNIPANYLQLEVGRGSTTISEEVGFVSGNDVISAIQGSIYNQIPVNMELVTVIPIDFTIDDKDKVKDPKSMTASKLAVKSLIITTPKKNVYSVLNVVDNAGLQVSDIIIGSVGDYYAFNSENLDKNSGVVINIGHETSTVSIFNKGILTNTEILEIGSANIDNDISFIYKVNTNDAKYLKENLALAHIRNANPLEYEHVTDKMGEKIKINQYEITEIVASRVDEILKLTKKQINLLTKKEISYIIITGGITEMKDFSINLENVYGKSATVGIMNTIGVRSGIYSCSLGMIRYFDQKMSLRNKDYSVFTEDELEELSDASRKINVDSDSILGKIFGYFFDN